MRRLSHDESGFSLVELVVVAFITVLVVGGLSSLFVSGLRASSTTNTTLASQTGVKLALERLEFETRCASQATLVSGGAGVTLTLPSQCTAASGSVSWCVSDGSLVRYPASSCTGGGETFAPNVTSATPFSCLAPVGAYPRLQVALEVNAGPTAATAFSGTDTIALRNAALTTSTSTACS